ncbi:MULTISPECIES: sugar ABC transporter substrate-binding protein [unclassified Streptomyces]|uniref:Sugar ABC transporter substrate-binding protein n=1 Tax=Streptomyces evansiae TaxID=3075535 RepID=A0ABD5E759_9ACTN|nr:MULTISPECIES: sugar ABC transporter substrate-binding protein [unclassified Streptomyces]ASY35543.1 sugar ABC transporter substrate-binding protein [Streptomyces sp. CLI2509]MDT0409680.1 sugar ABC transporter substrate-binding protein [Streptomyces sp. DSM 41979]MDT0417224.1 sugar ABC transporter substrate-binding protein [Streptomyces sp. DSM 41982]MDT0423137.1 sugar ABC transporter substrate-binding protein [Streptomyces sp. DSM 41859]MYQ60797.1 extracellular solute-binding protein [Strep
MRLIRTAGVAALAASALVLTACGNDGSSGGSSSDSKGGKTLTWWVMKGTNPDASTFYAAAKKEFKKRTGASLKIQEIQWADAHDRLVRAFASGDGPDVSEIGTTWTPEFAAAGGLTDVTAKLDKSGLGKDLVPALKASATYNGKQYGVGWYAGVRSIIYRKDVFEKHKLSVPKNWDELEQTVKTLKKEEPKLMPLPVAGDAAYATIPFVWGAGGELATEQGGKWTGTIDSKESKAGLDFYTGLALKDKSSSVGATTWRETDVLDSFVKGKSAMVIQGNWTPKTAIAGDPSLKEKIGAFPIPGKDGGINPAVLGGSNLAILKTSKNQDLAWQFVNMMTTSQLAKDWADQAGYFPSTNSALKPFAESTDPLVKPFAETMLKAGKTPPSAPGWGTVEGNKTIPQMVQSILTGTSVDKAAKTASDSVTKTLQEK